ncbi:MAG: GH3 auxin-responsive promoter family protein [Hyphomicrobiales bacterium]
MAIINSVLSFFLKKRIQQIISFIDEPYETQSSLLKNLINRASSTEFGKKYDFKSIRSLEEYKSRVPVNEYTDLKPWIDRLRLGEQNVLWPADIKWFAKSSGTTGSKSKYIPVSEEALEECHYKAGKDMLSIYINNHPNSKLFSGKGLVMGGSQSVSEYSNESYYDGDLSAILIQNLPFWAQFKKTPNISVALMEEWEEKIHKMASITLNHNVTSISGVPSWTMVLIKKIFELSNTDNLNDIWPNLEVFFHGGVSFDPYRDQFNKMIPSSKMSYLETYNASEGFFAIQDQINSNDLLLMLDYGIFYEFMPLNELGNKHPKTLTLEEVELNENYALIISSNAGLWRYMIGDTVKFTSLNPFRIKITGRTKSFINAFGEELIIDNAEKALSKACSASDASIKDYTAAPVYLNNQTKAAHEWLIEFERQPSDLSLFRETFDKALKDENSDYEAKRYKNMILQEPIVHSLPNKTFYKWMKNRGKLGGQNKVPRLSNHRDYVDEILSLIT